MTSKDFDEMTSDLRDIDVNDETNPFPTDYEDDNLPLTNTDIVIDKTRGPASSPFWVEPPNVSGPLNGAERNIGVSSGVNLYSSLGRGVTTEYNQDKYAQSGAPSHYEMGYEGGQVAGGGGVAGGDRYFYEEATPTGEVVLRKTRSVAKLMSPYDYQVSRNEKSDREKGSIELVDHSDERITDHSREFAKKRVLLDQTDNEGLRNSRRMLNQEKSKDRSSSRSGYFTCDEDLPITTEERNE